MTIDSRATTARPPDSQLTDAVRAYAGLPYVRLDVPGHAAQPSAQPELAAVRRGPAAHGRTAAGRRHRPRPQPNPKRRSAALAAQAWGAHRTWLLTNGGSNCNLVACLALRQLGTKIIVQRSMHSSVMDGMLLAGLEGHRPTGRRRRARRGPRHHRRRLGHGVRRGSRRGCGLYRVAQLLRRSPTSRHSPGSPTPAAGCSSSTRPRARTSGSTRTCPKARWQAAPTW
jgi:hypothetical protein